MALSPTLAPTMDEDELVGAIIYQSSLTALAMAAKKERRPSLTPSAPIGAEPHQVGSSPSAVRVSLILSEDSPVEVKSDDANTAITGEQAGSPPAQPLPRPGKRKAQRDRWDRNAHNFQTFKRIVGGVERRGAAAVNRAQFAAGTNPLQAFWAGVTASALEEIRRKKRDTWASKPDSERAWTEERKQSMKDAWAARPDAEKEEIRKKQSASSLSKFTREALLLQRSIDERLGASGVLKPSTAAVNEGTLPAPKSKAVGTVSAPKAKAVRAERCKLCTKFNPSFLWNCPGRGGDLLCVYFEGDGATKLTVCARCARHEGENARSCRGGRQGEDKCQYYKKNGLPRKGTKASDGQNKEGPSPRVVRSI